LSFLREEWAKWGCGLAAMVVVGVMTGAEEAEKKMNQRKGNREEKTHAVRRR